MMRYLLSVAMLWVSVSSAVTLGQITETGITINNFLCPSTLSPINLTAYPCSSNAAAAAGFNFAGGKLLQVFNDQAYWLLMKTNQTQYVATNLSYSGDALQQKMTSDGWVASGGFCLLITTNPILGSVVTPSITAAAGQEKVVVQLWYAGNQQIQLWSQDAAVLSQNQSFNIVVSSTVDQLAGVPTAKPSTNPPASFDVNVLQSWFLSQLGLQPQPSNRNAQLYASASHSPRSVKIQPV